MQTIYDKTYYKSLDLTTIELTPSYLPIKDIHLKKLANVAKKQLMTFQEELKYLKRPLSEEVVRKINLIEKNVDQINNWISLRIAAHAATRPLFFALRALLVLPKNIQNIDVQNLHLSTECNLPNDVWTEIALRLDRLSLLRLQNVCRYFRISITAVKPTLEGRITLNRIFSSQKKSTPLKVSMKVRGLMLELHHTFPDEFHIIEDDVEDILNSKTPRDDIFQCMKIILFPERKIKLTPPFDKISMEENNIAILKNIDSPKKSVEDIIKQILLTFKYTAYEFTLKNKGL